jgi:hypothetical protein
MEFPNAERIRTDGALVAAAEPVLSALILKLEHTQ